jgi:hypothetical protein
MFDSLENVEVKETVNYLPAGVHEVTIDKVSTSAQRDGYTGTPYTEFKVSNSNGIAFLKMSGADDKTSENAIRVRKEIFKGFLQAAGAKAFGNIPVACNETIGNKINVCLGEREYWTNDKDTGEPVIKTIVEYRFANSSGKPITWMDKYNKRLSPSDSAAYKAAHESYIGSNTPTSSSDLPF